MSSRPAQSPVEHPLDDTNRTSSALNRSGVLAAALTVGLPLLAGLAGGWSPLRLAGYLLLAGLFVGLVVGYLLIEPFAARADAWIEGLLALSGLAATGLLALSGDPFVQPAAFTVPLVIAVVNLSPRRAVAVGAAYTASIGLGLWLHGARGASEVLIPAAVYGAVMFFMFGVVRLAVEQAIERRRADALAAENARLAGEAASVAALAERNRIARDLHDTIAQELAAVTMQIEAAQRAFERDPERARARLARAHELARTALDDLRRSVWALAEPPVAGHRLSQAIAEQAARFGERTGIRVTYEHEGPPLALADEPAAQVLRIVQEALQNVERHAHATAVKLGSRHTPEALTVWVRDDGGGFDPASPRRRDDGGGFGLPSLHERARLAGGGLRITSAPGAGTTVELRIDTDEGDAQH